MNQYVNLKETEKKVFLSFHEDGLIDLFLNLVMMISGGYLLRKFINKYPLNEHAEDFSKETL